MTWFLKVKNSLTFAPFFCNQQEISKKWTSKYQKSFKKKNVSAFLIISVFESFCKNSCFFTHYQVFAKDNEETHEDACTRIGLTPTAFVIEMTWDQATCNTIATGLGFDCSLGKKKKKCNFFMTKGSFSFNIR